MTFKRNAKVVFTYPGGKEVTGRVVRPQPINFYDRPGVDLWYQVKLTDEHGTYGGSAHHSNLRPE